MKRKSLENIQNYYSGKPRIILENIQNYLPRIILDAIAVRLRYGCGGFGHNSGRRVQ